MILSDDIPQREEIEILLHECWEEIKHWDIEKANPNFDTYHKLLAAGVLHLVSARQEGELIGYATLLVVDLMQHAGRKGCFVDSIYLRKSCRVTGGYRMLKYIERRAKQLGAQHMQWDVTVKNDFGRTLERMGYKLKSYKYGGGL